MDSRRFDELTRVLASGSSRRRVLGALAGGLVAALGGRRAVRADHKPDHCAEEGQRPHPDHPNHPKPCCPGLVAGADGRCAAAPAGVACTFGGGGCLGLVDPGDDPAVGCNCFEAVGGGAFCGGSIFSCADAPACGELDPPCPADSFCAPAAVCGAPRCRPFCVPPP